MKNLILTLVLGASFGVGGAFAARSTLPSTPSPTNSVKAKKLLEGTDEAGLVATDSEKAQALIGAPSKIEKVLGAGAAVGAKEEENRRRRDARIKVAKAKLEVAQLEASEFEQNGQNAAEAG